MHLYTVKAKFMSEQMVLIPVTLEALKNMFQEIVDNSLQKQNQQTVEAGLLSPAEACKIFNPAISKVTLHSWTKEGFISSHRIGGRIFYKYADVIAAAQRIKKFDRNKQHA